MRRLSWPLLLALAACLDPTQATLELTTNAPCGGAGPEAATLYETGVLAGSVDQVKSGDLNTTTAACSSDGTIGTIVLYPQDGARDASAIAVGALGSRTAQECLAFAQGKDTGPPTDCIIARRRVTFVEGQDLRIPILLDNACAGVLCPEDQTCERATDAQGNVTTRCVSAVVECSDDGSCQPSSVASSTTGQGAGGAGGASTTTGTGGAGGASTVATTGTGGTGGGGSLIDAIPITTSLTKVLQVSGSAGANSIVYVAGAPPGIYTPGQSFPLVSYATVASDVTALEGTPSRAAAFASGASALESNTYTSTGVVDIFAESQSAALLVQLPQSIPTLTRVSNGVFSTVATDPTTTGSLRALFGTMPTFAVGTRVCLWAGAVTPDLVCETPAGGPMVDVWSDGPIGYAVGGSTVIQLTQAMGSSIGQSTQSAPLDASLAPVVLSAVHGNFASSVWAGGKWGVGAHAYLLRSDLIGGWEEFHSATLPGIQDLWVTSTGVVYFVAGNTLYSFTP